MTAPTLDTAEVDGDTLTLIYDEALDEDSTPATSAFTLGGTTATVSRVEVSGSTVTLTLSSAVSAGDSVTLSYTAPGTAPLADVVGNNAANFTDESVTNTTLPSVSITAGATVTEGADATFTVMADVAPASNLSVNINVVDGGAFVSASETGIQTVMLPMGTTSATLRVSTEDDRIDEMDGTITAVVETGMGYTVVASPGNSAEVTVSDNDVAGVTVRPTTGLVTTEAGGEAAFTVVLDTQPTANVIINVRSNNTDEGTVSADMLTFTNADWNRAQTVTVAGVDDMVDDEDQTYTIVLAPATSPDSNYNNVNPADVSVSNMDNDEPPTSITLAVQPVSLSEGDDATNVMVTATFDGSTVLMNTRVALRLGGSATGGGTDYSANVSTITIVGEASMGTATLTITPIDDNMVEGEEVIEINGTAMGGFTGTVNSVTVALTDNDVDETPPMLTMAIVNGTTLTLTYSEALDMNSRPATTDFMIMVAGTVVPVNMVAISGSTVTLTLASAASFGEMVTVAYTVSSNPVRDVARNNAAALTTQTVTNNTPRPTAPTAPTAVMTSADAAGELEISWPAPDPAPANGYEVQYRIAGGSNWEPTIPETAAMDATSYTFTGLAMGMYHARVRSVVGANTSDWAETSSPTRVDVRTVRIDSDISANRNRGVTLGCIEGIPPDCTLFNLEVLFRGNLDTTAGLRFRLTDAPDHGHVTDDSGSSLPLNDSLPVQAVHGGDWVYYHHDSVASLLDSPSLPSAADEDALMDSLEFEFEDVIYRVNIAINQPPEVVGSPSMPGPFTAGTAATFDVADDFTDPSDDTLTYRLGTVTPATSAVSIDGNVVTIGATATAGTYTIPVEADDGGLSVEYEYTVEMRGLPPTAVTATADAAGELAVSWTEPTMAPSDGYHVQYSSDGGFTWLPETPVAVAMGTALHTFRNLAAGTYSARVRAVYSGDPSAWVQATAVQVDVYEVIADFEAERGENVPSGCRFSEYTYPDCSNPNQIVFIDVWFRGRPVLDSIANNLQIILRRAPAHGIVYSKGLSTVGIGASIGSLESIRTGEAGYFHNGSGSPSDTDPNAVMDSFEIEVAGMRHTVSISIFNIAPRIVDTPSAGPYVAGTERTFDVGGDFIDRRGETLTFSLGTVTGPSAAEVTFSASTPSVTIGMNAMAGTYNIPVIASDGLLETTYTYTVVLNPARGSNRAPTVANTPSEPGPFTAARQGTFGVSGDFTDPDAGTLSYALGTVTGPTPAAVTINGSMVMVGTTSTAGRYSIPVVATDNGTPALSVTHVYQVVVNEANRAPVVAAEPSTPGPFLEGVGGSFDVSGDFTDPDGDSLDYSLDSVVPTTTAITLADSTSVVTVGTEATAEEYVVFVVARDGGGLIELFVYPVNVLAVPEVSIQAVTASVAEGTLATFEVTAEPPPGSDLTVMLDVDDGAGEFISGPAPTTVTVGTGGRGTFTVGTDDDRVDEMDGTLTVTITSDAAYTIGTPSSASVAVRDNDVPEVSIASGAAVSEGEAATFTLTASSAPARDLLVNVSVADGVGEFISGPAPRMVTIHSGTTSATLTVPTDDDSMNEADGGITATVTSGMGYTVAAPPAHRATVTVSDDDNPEVSITAVRSPVTEGDVALFTVRASTASASDLTVNVSVVDSGSFLLGVVPTSVTINAMQTSALLRVATADDSMDEPGGTLTVTVTGGGADYTVAAAPGNRAIVVVNDNDGTAEPEVTITANDASLVEGLTLSFTLTASERPAGNLVVNVSVDDGTGDFISGTPPTTVTISMAGTTATLAVSTVNDSEDELDGTVTARVTSGTGYRVGTPSSATVAVTDDDDPEVSIAAGASPVVEGTSALFEVSATTEQASNLTVNVNVVDSGAFAAGGETGAQTVTIPSGSSMATLAVPTVDDRVDESDGTITVTLATGTGYDEASSPRNSALVMVTDNDEAGITVMPTSGLTTTEAGDQATFTVVLDTEPTHDVVIGVSSSDTTEGTVSTDMLTFTASDWDAPQVVTVTGVDDGDDDGTVTYSIELAAATSTDSNYRGEDPADVSVSNEDDDGGVEPTITLTAGTSPVTEGGDATFTVSADPAPTSNLTVSVSVTESGSFISGSPSGTVTILASTTSATLTVSTDDDSIDESNGSITARVTTNAGYMVGTPSSAMVTMTDDDTAGITVTQTTLTTTETVGGTASFTVVLDTEPTADVVIGVSSSDTTEGTVSTDELTFTASDWDDLQTVTVTGVDDSVDDGNQDYTIELAAVMSADDNYNNEDPADVSVSNEDNDAAPTSITLTVQPNTLSEGAGATNVMVTATFDGSAVLMDTTVTLSLGGTATSGGTDYSATAPAITIPAEASSGMATFDITPVDDSDAEGNETIVISGVASGGFDSTVNSATVTLTDNDVADSTAPTLTTAEVNGATLTLTYSEVLDGASTPAAGAFTVMVAGSARTVSNVAVSGRAVTLTLSPAVNAGETVTVSYTMGTDPVRDVASNNAADFSAQLVTNNTPAATPSVRITAGGAVTEGGDASFTVTASTAPATDLILNVSVMESGSFISGSPPATVTIARNMTTATLTVSTVDDNVDEANGSITATVNAGMGYTVATPPNNSAMVMVNDNDMPELTIAAGPSPVTEGTAVTFTVTADLAPTSNLAVAINVVDSGAFAQAGTAGSQAVTLMSGMTSATLRVPTIDDRTNEANGTIMATLITGTGYTVGAPATAIVTVNDDDGSGEPSITIIAGTSPVTEGMAATFTVSANPPPATPLTVNVSVSEVGSFIASPVPAVVQIMANTDTATLMVSTEDDSVAESDGSVMVRLDVGTGYRGGTPDRATVEVFDNDTPRISIHATAVTVVEGTDVVFTVNAAPPPITNLIVNVTIENSGAFASVNETGSQTVLIPRDTSATTLTVGTEDDELSERDGSITATVTTGAGYRPGTPASALVSVTDDDGPTPQEQATTLSNALVGIGRSAAVAVVGVVGTRFQQRLDALRQGRSATLEVKDVSIDALLSGDQQLAEALLDWRNVKLADLLIDSAFELGSARGSVDNDAAGDFILWGRGDMQDFDSRPQADFSMTGEVISGHVGLDYRLGEVLLGVALGYSTGEVDYMDSATAGRGQVDSELLSLYPYVHWSPGGTGEDVLWAMVGFGWGEAEVEEEGSMPVQTDLEMRMFGLGTRAGVYSAGDVELAVKVDGVWLETESDAQTDLPSIDSDSVRARLALEVGRRWLETDSRELHTRLELGARVDAGDTEEGTGGELGVGVSYASLLGLDIELSGRYLVAHTEADFDEWGTTATVQYDTGQGTGRGLGFSLVPSWGHASSRTASLWEGSDVLHDAAGSRGSHASGRMDVRMSYGFGLRGHGGLLTPYSEFGLAGSDVRMIRLGLRLESLGFAGKDALLYVELGGEYEAAGGTDQRADKRVELTTNLRM